MLGNHAVWSADRGESGGALRRLVCCFAAQERAEAQGDVKTGRQKAEACEVCHGLDGLAKIAEAPNLAGQNEGYLIEQITAFKAGTRQNEMMSIVVQGSFAD